MPGTETAAAVERELRIDASPETIFEFFIDPDRMVQWMGRAADLDPRPGGSYRVDLNGKHVARGTYLELDPPRRVVFTWGWEGGESPVRPGDSTVEVTLEPDGESTLVRLLHRGLPSDESRAAHGHGWDHYLPRLGIAAGGGDAGPDTWADPNRAGE